eukprot:SAG11_NODE_537_length_8672_cov_3.282632_5_plen_450_part_00
MRNIHQTQSVERVEVILRRPKHTQRKPEDVHKIEIHDDASRGFDHLEIAISEICIMTTDISGHHILGLRHLLNPALELGQDKLSFCSDSFRTIADDSDERGNQTMTATDHVGTYCWRFNYELIDPLRDTVSNYKQMNVLTSNFARRDRALFHEVPDVRRKKYIQEMLKDFKSSEDDILRFTSKLNRQNVIDIETQSQDEKLITETIIEHTKRGASHVYVFKEETVKTKYLARVRAAYLGCFIALAEPRARFKEIRAQFVLRMHASDELGNEIVMHDVHDSSMKHTQNGNIGWGCRYFVRLEDVINRPHIRLEVTDFLVHESANTDGISMPPPWPTFPWVDLQLAHGSVESIDCINDEAIRLTPDEEIVFSRIELPLAADPILGIMPQVLCRAFAKMHIEVTVRKGRGLSNIFFSASMCSGRNDGVNISSSCWCCLRSCAIAHRHAFCER